VQILKKFQLYDIIYTEILAKQVFGRCPFVLCTNCVIDGCVKMLLQASIFTYGIIYTEILAKQVFGRCPFVLCTNCVIDGCVKTLLQASIFTYGIIFYEINSSGNINAEKRIIFWPVLTKVSIVSKYSEKLVITKEKV